MAKSTSAAAIVKTEQVKNHGIILDHSNLRKAAMVLRAINHKLRQQILDLIEEKGRITVSDIFVTMRIEQSVASQHLAILRNAQIVKTQREGKFIYYSIDKNRIAQITSLAVQLVEGE
jgi:ArsR family transcriptional regulator, virulence genes transcriptional regulator